MCILRQILFDLKNQPWDTCNVKNLLYQHIWLLSMLAILLFQILTWHREQELQYDPFSQITCSFEKTGHTANLIHNATHSWLLVFVNLRVSNLKHAIGTSRHGQIAYARLANSPMFNPNLTRQLISRKKGDFLRPPIVVLNCTKFCI